MRNKSIFLIYDTVNCTPNGDPDNGEQRYNDVTKRATITDLRIKRYGRDKLNAIGVNIFYFYDKLSIVVGDTTISGAAARFKAFCNENKIVLPKPKKVKKGKKGETDESEVETDESINEESKINVKDILLKNFIDVRIFGGVLTSKEFNAHITGALQFNAENESINEVLQGKNLINRGITTVFPSKDENGQGSMGRDSYLRYGLFCIKGSFSANTAKMNGATDTDLKLMLTAIMDGIKTTNTRSKFGQEPIACIVVEHPTKEVKEGFLGKTFKNSFKPFKINTTNALSDLYRREDYEFDFTPLKDKLDSDEVDNVTIYCDDDNFIAKHFSNLPKNCKVLNPLDELISLV